MHLLLPAAVWAEEVREVYRIGVLTDNYPYSFVDPERSSGAARGYVVDLLAAIEPTLGFRLERVTGPTPVVNTAFERGEVDLLQSLVPTEERRRHAVFSRPYVKQSGAVFVRRGLRVSRLEDLRGLRVMVHPGSTGERILKENGLGESVVLVASVEEAFRLLAAGANDATLASRLTGYATLHHLDLRGVEAVPLQIEGYDSSYCFAARRDLGPVIERIDEVLAALDPAEKEAIYLRWFGYVPPEGYSAADIAVAVSVGLGAALIVAVVLLMRQRRLWRQIAQQAERLGKSEEHYRAVFEAALDGVLVVRRPAGGAWLMERVNPAGRRILGEPAVAAGVELAVAFPADAGLWSRVGGSMESERPEPFEHDRSREGRRAFVEVAVARVGPEERMVVLRDTTEARLAAERVQAAEARALENQKLEAIGTLASGVAHDFNNILTAIQCNAEVLQMDVDPAHPAVPAVTDILHAAERARFLVRQILMFSRRSETQRQVVRVTRLVKESLRFVSATTPSSVEIRHVAAADSPAIEIDPTQVHQVVMNLCTNAVQAIRGQGGWVEVREEEAVDVPVEEVRPGMGPGRHLLLTVRDSGCGMEPEVLRRAFEPFFTTKPVGEGTGLGLSVVHGIVSASRGAIDLASEPGVGTTVRLWFPAVEVEARPPAIPDLTSLPRGSGERVLLVDDEAAIAAAAERLLSALGYVPCCLTQPVEALQELVRAVPGYDVVVIDLTMPVMGGIELARRVREARPGTPVVLVSGFVSDRDRAAARAAGVAAVMEKPMTIGAVAGVLRSVLSNAVRRGGGGEPREGAPAPG